MTENRPDYYKILGLTEEDKNLPKKKRKIAFLKLQAKFPLQEKIQMPGTLMVSLNQRDI
jgi:hypothetical protein